MSPFTALLWSGRRAARNMLAQAWGEAPLKVVVVSTAAAALWLLAFFGTGALLDLLSDFGAELLGGEAAGAALRDLLLARLLSLFALTLLVLLTVSNVAVSFATLFRERRTAYLMTAPVPATTLFLAGLAEGAVFSSWASAFLGSPVLIAYGLSHGAPPAYYLALVVAFVPFVLIPAAVGAMAALALARLVARLERPVLLALLAAAAVAAFAFFRRLLLGATPGLDPSLGETAPLAALAGALGTSQSPYLPSAWLARTVLDAAAGRFAEAGFHLLLLVAHALLLTWLATLLAERWLRPAWQDLGDRRTSSRPASARRWGLLGALETLLAPLGDPERALVAKDVRTFWREPAQWTQFVLFFGLLALYVAGLEPSAGGRMRGMVTLLNVGACLLILATLTTRFVFPLISLEGRRFWILHLAPVSRRRLMLQKMGLSVVATGVFTLGLALLTVWRLGLGGREAWLSVGAVAAGTVALSGLAVGLGAVYPDFGSDNPARITSGLGGTLCFLVSAGYVMVVLAGLGVLMVGEVAERVGVSVEGMVGWVVAGVLALTIGVGGVPMVLGVRRLERLEL